MKVTMLGSGTSSGVPVIGCECSVCTSSDPRDQRTRSSLKIELEGGTLLVDASTDLRQQALAYGLDRVDGVLLTHAHADHIFGLDDLRIFNFRQRASIPCFGSTTTLEGVRRCFWYVFEEGQLGGGKPQLELVPVDGPFEVLGETVVPIPVRHGQLPVYGYRLGSFAYVTDVSRIPASSLAMLQGLEVLILGALRYHPHPTHFTIEQAVRVARQLDVRRTYFTHLAHEVQHAAPQVEFPSGVEFGYDGLVFELS